MKRSSLLKLRESEDPRAAEGMARLAKLDGDIAALRKRIAELEDNKSTIQTEIAKITGQESQKKEETGGQNQEEMIQKAVAAATAAIAAGTSTNESLSNNIDKELNELSDELDYYLNTDKKNPRILEIRKEMVQKAVAYGKASVTASSDTNKTIVYRVNEELDEESRINNLMDELSDELVYYLNNDKENPRITEIRSELRDLQNELGQLELDQMDHEDSFEEEDSNYMYEGYASKFRPGQLLWNGKTHNISKVENVNDQFDIVYVNGKSMNSKHLENQGAEMVRKPRKSLEKRMSKREYESTLKDVMASLSSDQEDVDFSIIADQAETLLYDPELKDYLSRKWKKDYGYDKWYDPEPTNYELKDILMNDLQMFESDYSKKNSRSLKETYVEQLNKPEEDYEDKEYVFYAKISDDEDNFIGKIFKISPDGDWFGLVKQGESETFQKISYPSEYDESDIIEFLADNYDTVELIDSNQFNEFIEDEEVEESWPTNSIASSRIPERR